MALIGRTAEVGALTALLDDAEAGKSGAFVLLGEAGIGKTTLLETMSAQATGRGMATAAVSGVQEEAPLGYAALHRLLRLFPGSIDKLPPPQRDALRFTLGLVAGPPPDRFLVGLGLLTLLAGEAADTPLVMVIDDAQWLDAESGTVLGFAARRLQAERVVMLFAARQVDDGPPWLRTLPELRIGRLGTADAAQLLSSATGGFVSPGVEARLLETGGGNPLALVEIARSRARPADLAPGPHRVPVRHQRRLRAGAVVRRHDHGGRSRAQRPAQRGGPVPRRFPAPVRRRRGAGRPAAAPGTGRA